MAVDSELESRLHHSLGVERFISKVEEVLKDWKLIEHSLGKLLEKAFGFHLHLELILCHSSPYPNFSQRELVSQEF